MTQRVGSAAVDDARGRALWRFPQLVSQLEPISSGCLRAESGIDILLAQPGIAKTNIFDKSDLNPTEKPAAQLQVTGAGGVVKFCCYKPLRQHTDCNIPDAVR